MIIGSLNTQEVSEAVQSIRAPVQIRDVTGNHFLVPSRKMAFGKMYGVGEVDDLPQEIRPGAKTLDDPRDFLPA